MKTRKTASYILIICLFALMACQESVVDDNCTSDLVFNYSDPNYVVIEDTVLNIHYVFQSKRRNINELSEVRIFDDSGQLVQKHSFRDDRTRIQYNDHNLREIILDVEYQDKNVIEVYNWVEGNLDSNVMVAFLSTKNDEKDTFNYFLPTLNNNQFVLKTDLEGFSVNSEITDSVLIEFVENKAEVEFAYFESGDVVPMVENHDYKRIKNSKSFSTDADLVVGRIYGFLNSQASGPFGYHLIHVYGDMASRLKDIRSSRKTFYQLTSRNKDLKDKILCSGKYQLKGNGFSTIQ